MVTKKPALLGLSEVRVHILYVYRLKPRRVTMRMRKKYFILLSMIFITLSLFQLSKVAEAINYDTEIGLTFNSDVSVGGDSSSSTTLPSSTTNTSESKSTTNTSEGNRTNTDTSSKVEESSKMNRNTTAKSGLTGVLPSTGTKSNVLLMGLGMLVLILVFAFLIFKFYKVVIKNTDK